MDEAAVAARVDALAQTGEGIGQRYGGRGGDLPPEFYSSFRGWHAQGVACLLDVVGRSHPYYEAFESAATGWISDASNGAAILGALANDIRAGYLRSQADLIAAEVFTDFLDMAGHLLQGGYVIPAASLIGAVAEDGLRRLARANEITVGARDDMNALNSKLRENKVYSPLIAKRVTLWADIRNNADHGHFEEVTRGDVDEMYKGVTDFLAERLG